MIIFKPYFHFWQVSSTFKELSLVDCSLSDGFLGDYFSRNLLQSLPSLDLRDNPKFTDRGLDIFASCLVDSNQVILLISKRKNSFSKKKIRNNIFSRVCLVKNFALQDRNYDPSEIYKPLNVKIILNIFNLDLFLIFDKNYLQSMLKKLNLCGTGVTQDAVDQFRSKFTNCTVDI